MQPDPDDPPGLAARPERRSSGEQRRYNRRAPVSDANPPYYDVFDRIATALEGIERCLAGAPAEGAHHPDGAAPAPRRG